MSVALTIVATTKLWTLDSSNLIAYPSTHDGAPGGPYSVVAAQVAFDPINKTGGAFWFVIDGPDAGYLISQSTNALGYGTISVDLGMGSPGTPGGDIAQINPLANWRILIKGMGSGGSGTHALSFNADTELWSRTSTGIISWPSTVTASGSTGPYRVNPITVPYDPIHQTGGSFWELKEGPNVGFLVSAHSNSLGYGDISVAGRSGDRGPGDTLATIYKPNAHLAGASKLYNRAGEMHFTLLVGDPNVGVPVPKQTHYAIEFEQTPGEEDWVEEFAGLIWDIDQTDTEAVFYGIDYLALLQFIIDERFSPDKPDLPVPNGSKYVAKTITEIVTEQLQHAVGLLDSPVGFITVGSIAAMTYRITIFSTLQSCLPFVVGLLDSWRAGTSKLTELRVQKTGDGTYEFTVEDDPGVERPALALEYGILAQGYQVREFGKDWASRVNMIGRDPTGRSTAIQFESVASPQSEALWGRIAGAPQYVESIDKADMKRRALQAAIDSSRIGRQVGVGTKLGSYRPFEAYNLLDMVPVIINEGAVDTGTWSNDQFVGDDTVEEDPGTATTGLWAIIGIQWESYDDGHWLTTPLLYPKGKGAINLGNVQGAYAHVGSAIGDDGPVLPNPTTPGHILIAFLIGAGNTTVFPDRWVFHDDGSGDESEDWTSLGIATTDYTDMNSGGPDALAGVIVQIAWRRVFDAEKTQTPMTAMPHGANVSGGIWLYEVPETVIPTFVDTFSAHIATSTTQHFALPAHDGNLIAAWTFPTSGGHTAVALPAVAQDSGITVLTDAAETNDPSRLIDASTNLDEIVQMPAGGAVGLTTTPEVAVGYTSLNGCAVVIKLPDGVILPAIPYPADQVEGELLDTSLDSGPGTPPPPANGSGYGPPTVDTPATSTYTDLLTGQQYTFDSATGMWVAVSGTSYSDSGFYEFTFSAATTWTITHKLGGHPSVELFGTDGHEILADVHWASTTVIVVTFTEAVAGTATLR